MGSYPYVLLLQISKRQGMTPFSVKLSAFMVRKKQSEFFPVKTPN
jgi:hypothetical protein